MVIVTHESEKSKYLVHISRDLSNIIKKTHHPFYFLRISPASTHQCWLLSTGMWWRVHSPSPSASMGAAQKVTCSSLPSTEDIYISRCWSSAACIMGDPPHMAH